jgi:hypothetical protein
VTSSWINFAKFGRTLIFIYCGIISKMKSYVERVFPGIVCQKIKVRRAGSSVLQYDLCAGFCMIPISMNGAKQSNLIHCNILPLSNPGAKCEGIYNFLQFAFVHIC